MSIRIALGLLLAAVLAIFGFTLIRTAPEQEAVATVVPDVGNAQKEHMHGEGVGASTSSGLPRWNAEIRQRGAVDAHTLMRAEAAELPITERHRIEHAFGDALYDEYGTEGLSICVAEHANDGCLHQLSGRAIRDFGIATLPMLYEVCLSVADETGAGTRALDCQHGFGHGLLNFNGYTVAGLEETLAECDGIESKDKIEGCYGGAYMEYTMRTITNAGPQQYDPDDPYTPCSALSDSYADSCYYWLPRWKINVTDDNEYTASTFARAGEYCEGISDDEYRISCFKGIGYIMRAAELPGYVRYSYCGRVSGTYTNVEACYVGALVAQGTYFTGEF